jgi:ribonuclease HI
MLCYSSCMSIRIFTDGGCSGNPGPGGWAFVAVQEDKALEEKAGAAEITTNNQMELTAVIEGLRWAISQGKKNLEVHTDSQYVKNGITSWIHNWIKNGWKTAAKKPVKNQEYWIRLHELNQQLQVDWRWVKGHAGHKWNERCDQLVKGQFPG